MVLIRPLVVAVVLGRLEERGRASASHMLRRRRSKGSVRNAQRIACGDVAIGGSGRIGVTWSVRFCAFQSVTVIHRARISDDSSALVNDEAMDASATGSFSTPRPWAARLGKLDGVSSKRASGREDSPPSAERTATA